jgi:UDP-GlcNAc:undecaprenyl-phosphate GlcNAc-1-phosphate transferase
MALGLGTADDIRPLPPVARLLAEIATGLAVAIMVSTRFSGVAGFVLVTIATVALMNAFNLLDGLDALCASVALFSAAGFAVILTGEARYLAIALCGAVAGFLVFNKPPARIYLGDGGAYVIGTGMAALLASAWGPVRPVPTGVAGLALVAVPAAELAFAVIRRARSRQSLLLGDRNHPYDQLVRRGWTREKAVASYAVVALVMAGVAVLTSMLRTPAAFALTGVSCIGLLVLGVHWGFIAPEPSKPTNHVQP